MPQIGYIVTGSEEESKKIARKLVQERLVACANIIGEIDSYYWWEGKINQDKENALIVKTTEKKVEKTKKTIKEIHNYENPAILFFDIKNTTKKYREWIEKEVQE